MTIEEAVKKATEAGWKEELHELFPFVEVDNYWLRFWASEEFIGDNYQTSRNDAFLDPLFWKSLGKALGWVADFKEADGSIYNRWLIEWHRFIDHLAAGKTTESFFHSL